MIFSHERYCPKCGRNLKLVAPTKELLPNRVGNSSNGVFYYYPSKKRYRSITSHPTSNYSTTIANKLYYPGVLNSKHILYDKSGWNIVPIENTKRKLKKGGFWIFSPEMVFFCSNCKQKLSINLNPTAKSGTSALVLFFVAIISLFVWCVWKSIPYWCFNVIGILYVIILIEFLIELVYVLHFCSNFVPTDEYDSLIHQSVEITILSINLYPFFVKQGNIYSAKIDDEFFQIYLEKKEKRKLHMHICGTTDEQKTVISFLNQKVKKDSKATLSLWFEGKYIGNAEVVEIYDCIEEKPLPDDAPKTKIKLNWSCDDCGFNNSGTSSECKSCGKYRK